jgi:nitric oxide synthase-interacting protein
LYCRECIYESLLQQKQDIRRRTELWEAQEKKRQEEEEQKRAEQERKELAAFEKMDTGVSSGRWRVLLANAEGETTNGGRIPPGYEEFKAADGQIYIVEQAYRDLLERQAPQEALAEIKRERERQRALASFWVPSLTPDHREERLERPSQETICPENPHPLRVRQLVRVRLQEIQPAAGGAGVGAGGGRQPRYECPVCRKALTNALRLGLLRSCGHLLCLVCAQNFVAREGRCFSCQTPCREKDIVPLQGATGYVAHDDKKVISQKSTPAPRV